MKANRRWSAFKILPSETSESFATSALGCWSNGLSGRELEFGLDWSDHLDCFAEQKFCELYMKLYMNCTRFAYTSPSYKCEYSLNILFFIRESEAGHYLIESPMRVLDPVNDRIDSRKSKNKIVNNFWHRKLPWWNTRTVSRDHTWITMICFNN